MPRFCAFGRTAQGCAAQVFDGPVVLWIWAELTVLHGQGPGARDFID